ncbi:hypothetical protein IF1G_06561 [Cordyceps javanica]|uniref:Uncharacterized protein n=1 Tax=Cordyceps javanica TaxID=43265 RepID=A0A545UYJ0_9HYPO|nr:hypothetical protein IF1G_06561 [Cordyceps javanica]
MRALGERVWGVSTLFLCRHRIDVSKFLLFGILYMNVGGKVTGAGRPLLNQCVWTAHSFIHAFGAFVSLSGQLPEDTTASANLKAFFLIKIRSSGESVEHEKNRRYVSTRGRRNQATQLPHSKENSHSVMEQVLANFGFAVV